MTTDLDDLAAEMRIVDLSARVRRAHRRGVRRRFVVVGVTAAFAALVAVVAVLQPWQQRETEPAGKLDGTLLTARDTGERIIVSSGKDELLRLPGDAVDLAVSPNGEWLAWRQADSYLTADLDGGEPRLVAETDDACLAPAWAPDGEPLLLTAGADGGVAWHDIESGKTVATVNTDRERTSAMCRVFPAIRPDGGYDLYYGTGTGFELRYLSPNGTFTDTGIMEGLRDDGDWEALTGLSPDGTTACVRADPGNRRCDTLIDLDSGQLLRDIGAGSAWFLPDGGLLTADTDGGLSLRDTDGTVTERATAPKDARILAYFPP